VQNRTSSSYMALSSVRANGKEMTTRGWQNASRRPFGMWERGVGWRRSAEAGGLTIADKQETQCFGIERW